ncbi:MAG: hypothetical protein IIT58_10865 [Treponema sp.]|nr:hypothetical protein [Treponema sp.]
MINCNKDVLKRIKSAKPGDPSVLVSLEALESLPEIYSATIVSIPFSIPDGKNSNEDWSVVATYPNVMYMPTVNLLSRIADARGVSGLDNGTQKQIIQLVDWNRITLNYSAPPQLVNYPVGYEVVKQGSVLQEDGTERISDPAIIIYNVFERCNELWTKEESATDNYKNVTVSSNGTKLYTAYNKQQACKYDSQAKRLAHLASEMKFAEAKASIKARNLVIRTLCGLQTGYNIEQLKSGCFYIGKILRSNFAIKSEHAARLAGLSKGAVMADNASDELYGYTGYTEIPEDVTPGETLIETPAEAVTILDRDTVIRKIGKYLEFNLVPNDKKDSAVNMLAWLESAPNAEENQKFWNRAIDVLAEIESNIDKAMIVK